MLGFIKKDLLLVKANLKLLIIIFFAFIFLTINETFNLSFVLPIMGIMLFISTFSYDEYNGWNSFVASLPNGRKKAIQGKYIASIILTIILTLISVLIYYLQVSLNNKDIMMNELINIILSSILGIVIIVSFMYPIIIKFGSTNGRIWMFVMVFLIVGICGVLSNFVDLSFLINTFNKIEKYGYFLIPLVSVIMLYISYKVSLKLYENKEF